MSGNFALGLGRFYRVLMQCCGAAGGITFGLMGLLVTLDVVFRNLNIDLIPASIEITEYMLMFATFVAAPWLLYHSGHIRVDVILHFFSEGFQRFLELFCNIVGLLVCAVLAYETWRVLLDSYSQAVMVFKELIFPEWWLNLPLLFSASLLTIEFSRRIFKMFGKRGS